MKYHGERKNSIVNFDVSGDNINRVIITSDHDVVIMSVIAKVSDIPDILNALSIVTGSTKSTYAKMVSYEDI